jgi:hypothetical protein
MDRISVLATNDPGCGACLGDRRFLGAWSQRVHAVRETLSASLEYPSALPDWRRVPTQLLWHGEDCQAI